MENDIVVALGKTGWIRVGGARQRECHMPEILSNGEHGKWKRLNDRVQSRENKELYVKRLERPAGQGS